MIKQVMTKDILSQLSVGSLRVPVYMLIICESFSMACFGGDFLHFDWTWGFCSQLSNIILWCMVATCSSNKMFCQCHQMFSMASISILLVGINNLDANWVNYVFVSLIWEANGLMTTWYEALIFDTCFHGQDKCTSESCNQSLWRSRQWSQVSQAPISIWIMLAGWLDPEESAWNK